MGGSGGQGHVGTKRGHVLRQEEGLLGWAQQWEEQANKRLEGGAAGGGTKYR